MEDIKRSYKTLCKKFHPDTRNGCTAKMSSINAAYGVLETGSLGEVYDKVCMQLRSDQEATIKVDHETVSSTNVNMHGSKMGSSSEQTFRSITDMNRSSMEVDH